MRTPRNGSTVGVGVVTVGLSEYLELFHLEVFEVRVTEDRRIDPMLLVPATVQVARESRDQPVHVPGNLDKLRRRASFPVASLVLHRHGDTEGRGVLQHANETNVAFHKMLI